MKDRIKLAKIIYCLLFLSTSFLCQAMELNEADLSSVNGEELAPSNAKNLSLEIDDDNASFSCCMFLFPEIIKGLFSSYAAIETIFPPQDIKQNNGFIALPDEIIVRIMEHLKTREYTASDLYNLSLLNKNFYSVMNRAPLRVTMAVDDIESGGFKHLTLVKTKIFVARYKNIKQLTIIQTGKYSPIGADKFHGLFLSLPVITHLSLKGNSVLGNQATATIVESLKSNKVLASLNLENCRIADGVSKLLAAALQNNDTLNDLNLRYNRVSCDTFMSFVNLNNDKRTVILPSICLGIYNHNPASDIHTVIHEINKNNKNIKMLDIGRNDFDSNGLSILSRLMLALQGNTNITALGLDEIVKYVRPSFIMDDIFLNLVAEMIQQNETIIFIDLRGNDIRGRDISNLWAIAKKRPGLTIKWQ